jgi:hypothetical protein
MKQAGVAAAKSNDDRSLKPLALAKANFSETKV